MRRSNPITRSQVVTVLGKFTAETLPAITARIAREELAKVQSAGAVPYRQIVDGREGAPLESVRPGGVIVFKFSRIGPVVDWIYQALMARSPVRSGRYQHSHKLFVNGVQRDAFVERQVVDLPPGSEVVLINMQPYARKIEGTVRRQGPPRVDHLSWHHRKKEGKLVRTGGLSAQAPDGVYEIAAIEARKRFPDTDISFGYRGIIGSAVATGAVRNQSDIRYPAIILKAPS